MIFQISKKNSFQIDENCLPLISGYNLNIQKNVNGYSYVVARLKKEGKVVKRISIHRLLTNAPKGLDVDHINGNSLDNRMSNLRVCVHSKNTKNRKINKDNKSGYKGVVADSAVVGKPWRATIKNGGKTHYLGRYQFIEDAAKAYDSAAIKYFGEFARLNFPLKN